MARLDVTEEENRAIVVGSFVAIGCIVVMIAILVCCKIFLK